MFLYSLNAACPDLCTCVSETHSSCCVFFSAFHACRVCVNGTLPLMSYALRAEIEFHTHVHRAHVNTNTISLTNSLFILWNKLNTRKRRKQAEYSQVQTHVTIKNLLDELCITCASANSNFENKLTLTESSGPSAKRSWPFHYRDHPLSPSRTATALSTVR